jgi:hypothetical protein
LRYSNRQHQLTFLRPSIKVGDFDNITEYEAINIPEKCHILSLDLSGASDNLPYWKNWNMCCEVAVGMAKRMGFWSTQKARVTYQKLSMK